MKELKHIHLFESLLDEANNSLVRKAKEDGGIAVGYTCYYIPEVLLNVDKAFSVRLRAPNTGSLDISSYYMTSFICGYTRALVERAFEGGYNFLDAYFASDTCQQMNRVVENISELKLIDNPNFHHEIIDAPLKVSPHGIKYFCEQVKSRFMSTLEAMGCDVSDEAIRNAVKEHNKMCAIFEEISVMRKAENPVITPREFHILCLVSYSCPTALILPYLEQTLEELRTRVPDETNKWRARIVVVGSEIDDYAFSEIMELARANVVADRYCFGSVPGRQQIILNDEEDALVQVCRAYLESSQCPRFMSKEKVNERTETVRRLVEEYHADGVVYEQAKFCDFWGYERVLQSNIFANELGVPCLCIDREYAVRGSGQLSTRMQAFMESLEIKKIRKETDSNG